MTLKEGLETTTDHAILLRRTTRADGSSQRALRVYCESGGHSVLVDACRQCRSCVGFERDPDGLECAVRCPGTMTRTAGGALCRGVTVVEPDVSMARVVDLLAQDRTMTVVVFDRGGRIVGVIHESQVLDELLARRLSRHDPGERRLATMRLTLQRASEAVVPTVAIEATTPLRQAMDMMARNHSRVVVVVDSGGVPLGLLRDVDGLHALFGPRNSL